MIENGESTSVAKPSTESDQAHTAVGIDYAEAFLQKHCDDRPNTSMTWLFDRVGRGLYRLTPSQQKLADGGF